MPAYRSYNFLWTLKFDFPIHASRATQPYDRVYLYPSVDPSVRFPPPPHSRRSVTPGYQGLFSLNFRIAKGGHKRQNQLSRLFCSLPSVHSFSQFFFFNPTFLTLLSCFPSYRVLQVSCNIKNRHIFASRNLNQFLKKILKRSWSAVLACKISW